jgi:hypothetical protein
MQTNRRKKRIKEEGLNLVSSFIVAVVVTLITWFEISSFIEELSLERWMTITIYAAIFVFSFGSTFMASNWKRYKKRFEMNKYTLFLILSLIMSGLATWGNKGDWIDFIIGVGACFAVFFIFWKFDYDKIRTTFGQFFKSLAYGIIFPSMFLIIVLMGWLDNKNVFMDKVIGELTKVGDIISNALIYLVQILYDLGKYKYSIYFIIAIFIFSIFFALEDFIKKTKEPHL